MKRFATILFSLIPFFSFSQQSNVCGVKVYKGDQTSTDSTIKEFVKVRALADGTIIHGGQADEGADANFSLTKTGSDGSIIWQKVYGTEKLDVLKFHCHIRRWCSDGRLDNSNGKCRSFRCHCH